MILHYNLAPSASGALNISQSITLFIPGEARRKESSNHNTKIMLLMNSFKRRTNQFLANKVPIFMLRRSNEAYRIGNVGRSVGRSVFKKNQT